jgi:hypothetical protein
MSAKASGFGKRYLWIGLFLVFFPPDRTLADSGSRLWGTGGVTTIAGASGGGLTSWGVLNGYASDDEWSGSLALSRAAFDDYDLTVVAAAFNWDNRVALSISRQRLNLRILGGELKQDVFGAKFRLFGDVLYSRWGQWSLALEHGRLEDFSLPEAVGARDASGTDIVLSGSKVFFAAVAGRNLLLNAGVRASRANQAGLLGYGGDRGNGYAWLAELSGGIFLDRHWLAGLEYRQKPDNLAFAREDDWYDLFVAYIPNRTVAVTAAWVELGSVAGLSDQTGPYLSLQATF